MVSEAGTVHDVAAAQRFLRALPAWAQKQGKQLLARGAVRGLRREENGRLFTAEVMGLEVYPVALVYDAGEWFSECDCPVGNDCDHAYAVMASTLAGATAPEPAETGPASELAAALAKKLQRELTAEERRYLKAVNVLFQRARSQRGLTEFDLQTLGLKTSGYPWERLQLWPSMPKTEVEFWNYLAYALRQRGAAVPRFMLAVTDIESVARRVARMERERQIADWQTRLSAPDVLPAGPASRAVDFRLVLAGHEGHWEWRYEDETAFHELKATQARRFDDDDQAGRLEVLPEASPLWHAFLQSMSTYRSPRFGYADAEAVRMLNPLLRLPLLRERIVTAAGMPFVRATEPLRWRLEPAQNDQDDYRFQLALPDGSTAPPMLLTLPGHPALYVSADTIFVGPPVTPLLDAAKPNLIPAPALETSAGVEFLQQLGLDLPSRLKARTVCLRVRPQVRCELKPAHPGSASENLLVRVTAQAEGEDLVEEFTEAGWQPQAPRRMTSAYSRYTPWPTVPARPRPRPRADNKIVVYDRAAVGAFPRLLEPLAVKWDYFQGAWKVRVGKNFPEKFVPWLASLPPDVPVELAGELASLVKGPVPATVRLECQEAGIDWFDLKVVLDTAQTELTPAELKALLDARGRFVRLGKQGWRRLEFNLTAEEDEQLARLGLNPLELSSEPQRLHALQLADPAAARFLPERQVEQIRRRVGELQTRVNPPVPESVRAQLRPYQEAGFHFLAYLAANRFGGILADDMGLGKTLQTLTWLTWLRARPGAKPKPALVVCPKSVMDTWRSEAERFTPHLRLRLWRGSDRAALARAVEDLDVLVVNYAQLRALGDDLVGIDWLAAILDEGQYIKNPESQTARLARALKADYRLALSGTPIENRLLDLWSLMAFAMPGVLGNRAQFTQRFDRADDPHARRRLAARVRPFLLRRTKAQVAPDLPDRSEEEIYCELEGEQKTLYRAEFKRAQQMLLNVRTREELNEFRFHFLTSLLRLRQICCHPALYDPQAARAESAKLNAFLELLEPLMQEGHKVLVFSQFVSMLDLLRAAVREKGWNHFYLAGDTENRGERVQSFQNAEGPAIFLISLKAGGFGLNLTAASYVVLFDPWWNPAVENQAIDRTHRIGQTSKVIAYRLLARQSIEEKIRALQRNKSALVADVLGEDSFAKSLTLEDLQFLFADAPA